MVDPMLKSVGDEFASKMDKFDLMLCDKCYNRIRDENGELLSNTHECEKKLVKSLSEEVGTVLKKYFPNEKEKDKVLWVLHKTTNSMVTKHLKRRSQRKKKRPDIPPET